MERATSLPDPKLPDCSKTLAAGEVEETSELARTAPVWYAAPGKEEQKKKRKMRKKKMARLTWMTLTFTTCIAPSVMAASDRDAGRDLAATWCSSCHLVEQKAVAVTQARPLAAIARDGRWTADALRGFLARPHGGMPDLHLTRQEIENLAAYIETLAR